MTKAERLMRLGVIAKEELATEAEDWWYLSFAEEAGFIGGMIVRANGVITARLRVAELGLSPGGEMLAFELDEEETPVDLKYADRLLTKHELDEAFNSTGGAVSIVTGERVDAK